MSRDFLKRVQEIKTVQIVMFLEEKSQKFLLNQQKALVLFHNGKKLFRNFRSLFFTRMSHKEVC